MFSKDNLLRHQKFCRKLICQYCRSCFINKKELKAHEKSEQKLLNTNKILEFIGNREKKEIESMVEKIHLEMMERKRKLKA